MKTFYGSTAGEWRSWLAQSSGIGEGSLAGHLPLPERHAESAVS
jgi:hypothetical protein